MKCSETSHHLIHAPFTIITMHLTDLRVSLIDNASNLKKKIISTSKSSELNRCLDSHLVEQFEHYQYSVISKSFSPDLSIQDWNLNTINIQSFLREFQYRPLSSQLMIKT